jgi:hypothetical protein
MQNSKYRAISIICSSKRQTDWTSGLMYPDFVRTTKFRNNSNCLILHFKI